MKFDTKRLRLEATAFAYVMRTIDKQERERRLMRFRGIYLADLAASCGGRLNSGVDVTGPDAVAILRDRSSFRELRKALQDFDLVGLIDGTSGVDPQAGEKALGEIESTDAETLRRGQILPALKSAAEDLEAGRIKPEDVRDLVSGAISAASRIGLQDDDLEKIWREARATETGPPAGPYEALLIDEERRGYLARWLNAWAGPRGGLMPGMTMIAGGAPGAGKTSLASLYAVDALNARIPVLAWQLELGAHGQIGHLASQMPLASPEHAIGSLEHRWPESPPPSWSQILQLPPVGDVTVSELESVADRASALADDCRRRRKGGEYLHAVNGLVIVDYVQLLTLRDKSPNQSGHDVLSTVASRLAKLAADEGFVLFLASQLTKEGQKLGETALTDLSGADLGRVAHVAVSICKAAFCEERSDKSGNVTQPSVLMQAASGVPAYFDRDLGDARILKVEKDRGHCARRLQEDDGSFPERKLFGWSHRRLLHAGVRYGETGEPAKAPHGHEDASWFDSEVSR